MKTFLHFILLCALAPIAGAESKRLLVVVSDTHFGVGHDPGGAWNPMEDARWSREFAAFLAAMDQKGAGATDLLMNGDTFELWQSVEKDCIYPSLAKQDRNLGCTEADALKRVGRVLREHSIEMKALGKFAASGNNRVILLPGNHDAALTYPQVAGAVLKAIGAPAGRATVAKEGYWRSPDGAIYAEHGHQIGEEVNRFDHWPKPFLERQGIMYLQRPWGEQMVQQFYNDYEIKYPVIDNFVDDSIGLGYAFAAEGKVGALEGAVRFFRLALFRVSLKQFATFAGGADSRNWDVDTIRSQGARFLAESIPAGDPVHDLAAASIRPGEPLSVDQITDDEIRDICDMRRSSQEADAPPPCPAKDAGATAQKLFRSARAIMGKRLKELNEGGAGAFDLYIYSHTHDANVGFLPFDGNGNPWQPRIVNTGAWQRIASKNQFEGLLAHRGISRKEALAKIKLEDLPACYDTLVVLPYRSEPSFELGGWRVDDAGKGSWGSSCR